MAPLLSADDTLARLEPLGMRLTLEPFRRLLAALGEPQRGCPAVLVGGTNGKGSTAALLAAIGSAAGYRTGLYTSPHLEEARERIRIDGIALPTLELDRLLAAVVDAAGEDLPTPFEALTAAGFLAFAEAGVELAVLEVGLGGRLDATNASEPLLSVIAPIALDHQQHLGDTLEAIAGEKAGILRGGRPAVAWGGESGVVATLEAAARAAGARLAFASTEAAVVGAATDGVGAQRVRVRTSRDEYRLRVRLAGAHQQRNLLLAIAAAERLPQAGWERVDRAAIEAGVAGCRWPGRLEAVALPVGAKGGTSVLLDGAHNPAGAAAVAEFVAALDTPFDLVFGALADKDVAGIAAALAPQARRVYLAPPDSPRAMSLAGLAALPPLGGAVPAAGIGEALERALVEPAVLLLVSGSLYLVGEARRWLRERFGVPSPAAETSTWVPVS